MGGQTFEGMITDTRSQRGADLLRQYASWVSRLQRLDLLHVDKLVPLVKGDELRKALDGKPRLWMRQAMTLAMEWQLRKSKGNRFCGWGRSGGCHKSSLP